MGFPVETIKDITNAGSISGVQCEVACDCWFTRNGKTMPRMIKIMDDEGIVHTYDRICMLYSEEKCYGGIETIEHYCQIIIDDKKVNAKIILRKDTSKWTIIFQ